MKYSIVIPHLSNSRCIDLCLKYIKENSLYEHEIVEIIDEKDAYYAFNKGVYQSKCDIVVLLSDDMIVSKHWDKFIPIYASQNTILTGYVIEPNPGTMRAGPTCIKHDCGGVDNFEYDKFQNYVDYLKVPEIKINSKGWYQPLVVNKKSFVTYPNINKFPEYANDVTLIDAVLPNLGYKFAQIPMFVYHFQKRTTLDNIDLIKKKAIFTYCNHQIEDRIPILHNRVIDKFNNIQNCKYEFLKYNAPDGQVLPDQVIDYAFNKLFFEDNYDTILMLDIDCIPLRNGVLEYMLKTADKGTLVGNIQRSNHIQNNKHVYVAPSCMAISKETFVKMGKPSFKVTNRGDIGEELTYIAENSGIPIEMFLPKSYEKLPYDSDKPWDLADGMPVYGIGTTFENSNKEPMFYHLFQSRVGVFNDLFFLKCAEVILNNE